jgi:hypothetical protein
MRALEYLSVGQRTVSCCLSKAEPLKQATKQSVHPEFALHDISIMGDDLLKILKSHRQGFDMLRRT